MKLSGNWKKRVAKILAAVMILTCVPLYDCQEAEAASPSDFINDTRWCHGTSWPANQGRKIDDSWSGSGCFAYVADFVKYIYMEKAVTQGVCGIQTLMRSEPATPFICVMILRENIGLSCLVEQETACILQKEILVVK